MTPTEKYVVVIPFEDLRAPFGRYLGTGLYWDMVVRGWELFVEAPYEVPGELYSSVLDHYLSQQHALDQESLYRLSEETAIAIEIEILRKDPIFSLYLKPYLQKPWGVEHVGSSYGKPYSELYVTFGTQQPVGV